MLENARNLINEYALNKTVAVAVSGGEDSMALLCLMLEYKNAGKLKLIALNVDHCLRENSASDSEFVRGFCLKHNVECISRKIDIPELCRKSGRGFESEAHFARRAFFTEIVSGGKADMVATAHHARDNVETVLLHLFRGAGLKGLSGMKTYADGLFRPFLTTGKNEIAEYVISKKIEHVTDESNFDNTFSRNYIRNEILPVIAERFPAFEKAVCRTADFAAEADGFIAEHLNKNAITESGDAVSVSEEYISAPYIFEALKRMGKTADVYYNAVDGVIKLKTQKPCARINIGNGIIAAREYGKITFYRDKKEEVSRYDVPFSMPENSILKVGDVTVERVDKSSLRMNKSWLRPRDLVFCADSLPPDCIWRTRRDGDRFTPFGGGTRKLKEYLIDMKVPQRFRDFIPLLCSGDNVLVIAGIEIADSVKVTHNSETLCRVRISEGE